MECTLHTPGGYESASTPNVWTAKEKSCKYKRSRYAPIRRSYDFPVVRAGPSAYDASSSIRVGPMSRWKEGEKSIQQRISHSYMRKEYIHVRKKQRRYANDGRANAQCFIIRRVCYLGFV